MLTNPNSGDKYICLIEGSFHHSPHAFVRKRCYHPLQWTWLTNGNIVQATFLVLPSGKLISHSTAERFFFLGGGGRTVEKDKGQFLLFFYNKRQGTTWTWWKWHFPVPIIHISSLELDTAGSVAWSKIRKHYPL